MLNLKLKQVSFLSLIGLPIYSCYETDSVSKAMCMQPPNKALITSYAV